MRFTNSYLEALLFVFLTLFSQGNGWYSSSQNKDKSLLEKLASDEIGDKTSMAVWQREAQKLLLELNTPGTKVRASCEKLVTGIARNTGRDPTTKGVAICDTILTLGAILTELLGQAVTLDDPSEALLNVIVVFLFRNEGKDCMERLLCEANKQAASRYYYDAIVAYLGNLGTALFATDVPLSMSWDAIRFGRLGYSCEELYPRCPIFL